jgi:hypothetical protein
VLKPITLLVLALASMAANAGPADKIYTPLVVKGETEFELRGGYEDADRGANPYQFVFDVGYGVSDRWLTELVVKYEDAAPGGNATLSDLEWENVLVLSEPGRHWLDFGLFSELEYERASKNWELKIGPMFEKVVGREQFNLNLLLEQKFVSGANTELLYRGQWKHRAGRAFEYGLQAFGELGEIRQLGDQVEHKLGPAVFGSIDTGGSNRLGWDFAVLAGLNAAAPDLSLRFELEFERY